MYANKALKAVLVGCGGISKTWLEAIVTLENLTIVALIDLAEVRARQRAAEFGLDDAVVGSDLAQILASAKPDIVFDCTVPEAHYQTTMVSLAHGCHVLGEKPLADTMDRARQMVTAAHQKNRLYAVMQNRRYLEVTRRIRHFLASGAIGEVTTLNCDFYLGPHFGGFREQMEHVLLMDMAIHTFDQARFMSGCDPVSVFCKEWNPPGSWYSHGASAMAIFKMTNQAIFNYRGSWCAEGLPTTWEAEWRFVGTRGTLKWDGAQNFAAEVANPTGAFWAERQEISVPPYLEDEYFYGHASCIREFVDCVRTARTPNTIASDNIKSLAMVFSAIESALGEKVVVIEEQADSFS